MLDFLESLQREVKEVKNRPRWIRLAVLGVLAGGAGLVLWRAYAFGQERFFTIDEYQYGHATWLVSQGQRPYVDFFEHHFPLSYVAHAPFAAGSESFSYRALRLRRIPFVYMLGLAAVLVFAVRRVTDSSAAALLAVALSFGFGFSLMSAVDYRADNFAAFLWLACLALLEANRGRAQPGVAAACGALFAAALLMTQKMLVVAGGAVALYLAADLLRRRPGCRPQSAPRAPCITHPALFAGVAAAILGAALAALALLGLLPAFFEATILQAVGHEASYPDDPIWPFAAAFFRETPVTTSVVLALAAAFLVLERSGFWAVALATALGGGLLLAGQYPYNFVLSGTTIALLAARGTAALAARAPLAGRAAAIRPALFLLPLALLPDQLGFVAGRTSNAHQLRLLDKIERYTAPDDVVIDGAGGALFRPHASYYWYHGLAHRVMFAEYFERELVEDYRRSRAPLWIEDGRLYQLPEPVVEYFRTHYVRADGSLHALGFLTPETPRAERRRLEVEIVRAGEYHVLAVGRPLAGGPPGGLVVDGVPVRGSVARLEPGPHEVVVEPNAPRHIVSLLPRSLFQDKVTGGLDHSLLFEFERKSD